MEPIKFKNLTDEQIRRFPFQFTNLESSAMIERDANYSNLWNLTTYRDRLPSQPELDLAVETMKKLPSISQMHFICSFTKMSRQWTDFSSRFKLINQRMMPLIVDCFNTGFEKSRRERKSAYSGRMPEIYEFLNKIEPWNGPRRYHRYASQIDLISNEGVINKGTNFELEWYMFMEHGAIDAEIRDLSTGTLKKVILFPDEIKQVL